MALRVDRGETLLESEPATLTLNVLPPNPIFLAPPARIERSWTETKKKKDSVLTPNSVPLEIIIEFPDGLKRDLTYSRLFVDDMLVDENTVAPFEDFNWDISELTGSGSHRIKVTIEDSAGFIAETVELPVELHVQPKPQTWIEKLLSAFTAQTIALFVVITAAGALLLSLVIRTLKLTRATKKQDLIAWKIRSLSLY